jgi:hypothetical protein
MKHEYVDAVERWIESHRDMVDLRCRSCGATLSPRNLEGYMHSEGYYVEGCMFPVWLYIVCGEPRCGYENALWKLGVPGGTVFTRGDTGERVRTA